MSMSRRRAIAKAHGTTCAAEREAAAGAMDLEHRLLDDVLGPRAIVRVALQEGLKSRSQPVVDLAEGRVVAACITVHRGVERDARGIRLAVALVRHGERSITQHQRFALRQAIGSRRERQTLKTDGRQRNTSA